MRNHLRMAAAVAACAVLALSGCSRSPRVDFYTLTAGLPAEPLLAAESRYSVSVGPVTLPEMVDRPQMVLRVAPNKVEVMETHRWAESLKVEVPHVIAENLSRQLPSARVSAYPQNASSRADFKILVDITRFEAVAGEAVTVDALWSVGTAGATAKTGRSSVRERIAGSGYDSIAAAYSRALAAVSSDVAKAIGEVAVMRK